MALRAWIGQPGLSMDDPNLLDWAATLGFTQENGQPVSMNELLRVLPVYDDATGQVLQPAQQAAWRDYNEVSGAFQGAPTVPGNDGWSYVPLDAYKAAVSAADARSSPIWDGPLQLGLGLVGGAALSGLGGAGGAYTAGASNAALGGGSLFGAGTGVAGGAAALGDAAWGVNPYSTGLDWAAIDAGEAAIPWGEGASNLTPEMLGDAAGTTGGNSLADFFQQLQQQGVTGDQGGLSQLFNNLDSQGMTQLLQAGGTAGSALSRLLSGNGSTADWLDVLGKLGGTALGVAGSNAQQNALKDVYNQQMALGAPSRARYEASFQPGWSLLNADPSVQSGLDTAGETVLRKLSATGGNPYGNPGALAEANKYLLGNFVIPQTNTYRSINLTGGQLGTNTAGTASLTGAGQAGNLYNALGGGLGMLTQPENGLEQLLKKYGLGVGGLT